MPATLVTNDADTVRTFAAEVGELVVKPLAEPIVHEAGGHAGIYTRRVTRSEVDELAGVETTAHLFQQWVPKAYEVRLTMVGVRCFRWRSTRTPTPPGWTGAPTTRH